MIDVKDRVVENPHRYQLIAVQGEEGVYDIVPVPGTVTEGGTAINRALFNALQSDIPLASYLAFCGNVNSDMLDAAFGKGNEDRITGLGRQLAMYAWFKGDSRVTHPFNNLMTKNTLEECLQDEDAFVEINENVNISNLILASPYAVDVLNQAIGDLVIYDAGNEYIAVTGGWVAVPGGQTATRNASNLFCKAKGAKVKAYFITGNNINFNLYKYIKIAGTFTALFGSAGDDVYCTYIGLDGAGGRTYQYTAAIGTKYDVSNLVNKNIKIEIGSFSGRTEWTANSTFTKVWFSNTP